MTKRVVTISREWHNPKITTTLSDEGINLEIDLEDFRRAMLREIGSVAFIVSREAFEDRFDTALNRVMAGIKYESKKVVVPEI